MEKQIFEHLPSKLTLKVLLFLTFTSARWLLNQNIIMFSSSSEFTAWHWTLKMQKILAGQRISLLSPSPRGSGLKVTFLVFPRPWWIRSCSQGEPTAYLPPLLATCGRQNTWDTFPAQALQSVLGTSWQRNSSNSNPWMHEFMTRTWNPVALEVICYSKNSSTRRPGKFGEIM